MLTMQQVNDLATSAEKTKIFSADYQKTERRQAERILELCATIRELRALMQKRLDLGYWDSPVVDTELFAALK